MPIHLLPVAKSIILCDDMLVDPATEKAHLIGIFNSIRPVAEPPFPHRHPQFSVFLQLTDAEGEIPARIACLQAETDHVIFLGEEHRLVFLSRTQLKSVRFRIRDCRFPSPGLYWIQLLCHGQLVVEQRLMLRR